MNSTTTSTNRTTTNTASCSSSTKEVNKSSTSPLSSYRQIRASYNKDEDTLRVYQAYNDQIAKLATDANSFQAPLNSGIWSDTRMTWIKPSKVWMAYRCGWTVLKNDVNQRRVLALDISRSKLEELLRMAQLNHSHSHGHSNSEDNDDKDKKQDDERKCRNSHVVVQWDPERIIDTESLLLSSSCTSTSTSTSTSTNSTSRKKKHVHTKPLHDVRSIQIGLRGDGVQALLDPAFVLNITDVTQDFRNALSILQQHEYEYKAKASETGGEQEEDSDNDVLVQDLEEAIKNALWPDGQYEEVMNVSQELSNVLEMTRDSNSSNSTYSGVSTFENKKK